MSNIINKGWGHEEILISNELYCLKRMLFNNIGNYFSMHFHRNKHESWLVENGSFKLEVLNLVDASTSTHELKVGDTVTIAQGVCHRLTALQDNSIILEVSTADDPNDNYRVAPGMSQLVVKE